jgi:hypothetical protein
MKTRSFTIQFHKDSSHWVSVILYPSRSILRQTLRNLKDYDSSQTNAACWQAGKVGNDSCIAEIHFAQDHLTLNTIIHESTHAAYHRAIIMGVKKDAPNFQEWVAGDTGIIAEAIIAGFEVHKIPVAYEAIDRQMKPSTT